MNNTQNAPALSTPRLRLRGWREDDVPALAAMLADPEVMRYYPAFLTVAETQALVERQRQSFATHGFGLWAVVLATDGPLIGIVGLAVPRFQARFMPCVEVGWRLAKQHWGQGYASEAARAALDFGFVRIGLAEIVSFTARINRPSIAVMQRLSMRHDPAGDFDHPALPEGHPLQPHVLYRLQAPSGSRH